MCDDTYIPWLAALNIKEAFGAFVVVVEFLLVIRVKKSLFFLQKKLRILFLVYILAVGKHSLRNTPCLPNHICYASEESLHSRQYFWYYWQINLTHSSTRKTPQRRTLRITLRQLEKTYESSRHRCCLALNFGDNANHSHSDDRCLPLTDREARATQHSFTG